MVPICIAKVAHHVLVLIQRNTDCTIIALLSCLSLVFSSLWISAIPSLVFTVPHVQSISNDVLSTTLPSSIYSHFCNFVSQRCHFPDGRVSQDLNDRQQFFPCDTTAAQSSGCEIDDMPPKGLCKQVQQWDQVWRVSYTNPT